MPVQPNGMPTLPDNATNEDRAVHTRATAMLMQSEQLFKTAHQRYVFEGRGACVVVFQSVEHVLAKEDTFVIQYVDLVSLLKLQYPTACELTKVYNVKQCFVLVVGLLTGCHRSFAAVIAHRDTGKQMQEMANSTDEDKQPDFQPVTGQFSKLVNVPLYTQLNSPDVASMLDTSVQSYCAQLTCVKVGHLYCGRCRSVTYCSRTCQEEDWGYHKHKCN